MTSKKRASKKPLKVEKAKNISKSDKKIPRSLIIKYGDDHYILKAGLEWKANNLFGGAGYSLDIYPIEMDRENQIFVFKATLVVLENGARYVNYGEATAKNTNEMMSSQLLHLAITRAECRVLRMATACGYASYDEVKTINSGKEKVEMKNGNKPASEEQIATIQSLDPDFSEKKIKELTKQEAAETIQELSKK